MYFITLEFCYNYKQDYKVLKLINYHQKLVNTLVIIYKPKREERMVKSGKLLILVYYKYKNGFKADFSKLIWRAYNL